MQNCCTCNLQRPCVTLHIELSSSRAIRNCWVIGEQDSLAKQSAMCRWEDRPVQHADTETRNLTMILKEASKVHDGNEIDQRDAELDQCLAGDRVASLQVWRIGATSRRRPRRATIHSKLVEHDADEWCGGVDAWLDSSLVALPSLRSAAAGRVPWRTVR